MNGEFEYEPPALMFSQESVEVELPAGETAQRELYIGTEQNRKIRGYVTSSDRRLVPGLEIFSGTTIRLPFGIDAAGLSPGEVREEWLCFTTNVGEYKIPVTIRTGSGVLATPEGTIRSLGDFAKIAEEDFREAYRMFTEPEFAALADASKDGRIRSLYAGLSRQPVTYQNLEEFLIAAGLKEKVTVRLQEYRKEIFEITESTRESVLLTRSGWGHLRIDVIASGGFLEVEKRVITDEDFIGSSYNLAYVIRQDQLGEGNQFGMIRIVTPYQELTYEVMASRTMRSGVQIRLEEKKCRLNLMRDYLDYRCQTLECAAWAAQSHYELNRLKDSGFDYPEYRIYEVYVLWKEGKKEEAADWLREFHSQSFIRDNPEIAGLYLYLCCEAGLYKDKEAVLRRIHALKAQNEKSCILQEILLQMDPELVRLPSRALYELETLFDKGCKNPLLYLEAWVRICMDESLLHRLSRFWIQVFLFAGKRGLLTQELTMRFTYLSGNEKQFQESLYRALVYGYEAFPSDDSLEAICRYIMRGNPRRKEYFRWFELAVERDIRLTRVFEYYMETLDISYHRELPKSLLMYFNYNNSNLGDMRKAYIYADVIANKTQDPQTYQSYQDTIRSFAAQKIREGRISEDYALIYQEYLHTPQNQEEARILSGILFVNRLYCDSKKVRCVIVRHSQLTREELYPCVQGVAYPRIYTEDAAVLFQDDKQRRYSATVDYNLKKLMDERDLIEEIIEKRYTEPGILLNFCENHEISQKNLPVFQQVVQSDSFTPEYQREIRRRILAWYRENVRGTELDGLLKKLDHREYALVDKKALLEILIDRGLFRQAYKIVEEFGAEEMSSADLLKLVSRMIVRRDMREDDELIALSSQVYRSGIYDEMILRYLMMYRNGPLDELFSIRKSAEGFDLDTYSFDEKILQLLMLTQDYRKEGEKVLQSYVRESGKEKIIGAYLTQLSYGIFVKEFGASPFVRECLENAFKNGWEVDRVCHLALFKSIVREKDSRGDYKEMKEQLLRECMENGMEFGFFRKLSQDILSPWQLDDKTFVECHASPDASVTLHYQLDSGLGESKPYGSQPLTAVYQGIFVKTFTLFYGETLRYYFVIEEKGKTRKTAERVLTMTRVEGKPSSRYQLINQLLSSRKLKKDRETAAGLKQYLRQEQYVNEMFTLQ